MAKFHVNPETGNVNPCSASVKSCAFAVDGRIPEHFDTEKEAQKAAETILANTHGGVSNSGLQKENAESLAERKRIARKEYEEAMKKYEDFERDQEIWSNRLHDLRQKREDGVISQDESAMLDDMEYSMMEEAESGDYYSVPKPILPKILQ